VIRFSYWGDLKSGKKFMVTPQWFREGESVNKVINNNKRLVKCNMDIVRKV